MMIDELLKLVPIPDSPIDADDSVLPATVRTLGTQFPDDYLEYCRVYGSGTINVKVYAWEIYSPFRPSFPDFVAHFFEREDVYRTACETTDLPLGLFPEPGGLLPFGHCDDLYFCWKTTGVPNSWTVVVLWEYREGGYLVYEMGFSEFLVKLLTRKIDAGGFKSPWNPKKDITFESEVFGG